MFADAKTTKRSIKVLNRRREWLLGRLAMSKHDLSFDKAERRAVEFSIYILTALLEGQKVEVARGPRYTRRDPGQPEEEGVQAPATISTSC